MEGKVIKTRTDYRNIAIVESTDRQYAVISKIGEIIVPFGKYAWIDGFEAGLARVRTKGIRYNDPTVEIIVDENRQMVTQEDMPSFYENIKKYDPEKLSRWGIINMEGQEVLKVEYDDVWKFFGKRRASTNALKDGVLQSINFCDLPGSDFFFPDLEEVCQEESYGSTFGEYSGSYAQDVAGYSDDVINDAFEGDPEMYWNID